MNKPQINLQDTFLNQVRKENVGVMIYLIGGVQLRGNVRGFDSFTLLLDSPGKPIQLVYKHAITSIVPMRPIQNLYNEAMTAAGLNPQQAPSPSTPAPATPSPAAPPTAPVATTHPDASVTVQTPTPAPAGATPEAALVDPIS
jgi:host factor-I protein